MSRRIWTFLGILVLIVTTVWGSACHPGSHSSPDASRTAGKQTVDLSSYWTCPMHPQIHQDHSGECPICHMKLVRVSKTPEQDQAQSGKRSTLDVMDSQLMLIGVQKTEV